MIKPTAALGLLGLGALAAVASTAKLDFLAANAQGAPVLERASKSSTIAISNDDQTVVMVNPEADSISVFEAEPLARRATVKTGGEPSSVVIHPDGKTAFVTNRADATIVKVTNLTSASPRVSEALEVGSEPTGLALSPTGAKLFVAEWAEGRVAVVDTASMKIVGSIDAPTNPRAVVVTNDGDSDDNDEFVLVPEFFGLQGPGAEGSDESRTGLVRVYKVSDYSATPGIRFAPLDSGFVPDGTTTGTVKTSPNQFYAAAVRGQKVYVTSISASPKGPPRFNGNVQPVVYVGDLETRKEDDGKAGTVNLAKKVAELIPAGQPRHFLADLVDIAFAGSSNIAYTVSKGADIVQRVVFDEVRGTSIGSQFNPQIDVGRAQGDIKACQNPIGIVTAHDGPRAYVNCWVSRNLAEIDLSVQRVIATVPSSNAPTGAELDVNKGQRFFFTGRGRWSKESWSSCGSCHPDGLSDNITWQFAAGPRQTTSMDGTFSHGSSEQKQRILNWTGIFEELHDFERNTRDVSGGLGAVTTDGCGDLNEERRLDLAGGLDKPVREVQNEAKPSCTKDWDEIEAYAKTIRPPRALRFVDAQSVARGSQLFGMPRTGQNNGGCVACHGGAGWTVSRLSFTPSNATNAALNKAEVKVNVPPMAATWNFGGFWIQNQPIIKDTTTGPAEPAAIGPKQVACVLRNIGTFGIPGSKELTDALEKKADGTRAQGRGGYNVPSLYGMALGAPYLHHGQARTLEELFSDPKWEDHLRAANPVFLTGSGAARQRQDLINFILSIDAKTKEQPVPAGFDICPTQK
jgi:DNA-binding beta-propeller fold protein YncE/mono/diheme cytochrome c family protein